MRFVLGRERSSSDQGSASTADRTGADLKAAFLSRSSLHRHSVPKSSSRHAWSKPALLASTCHGPISIHTRDRDDAVLVRLFGENASRGSICQLSVQHNARTPYFVGRTCCQTGRNTAPMLRFRASDVAENAISRVRMLTCGPIRLTCGPVMLSVVNIHAARSKRSRCFCRAFRIA